MGQLVATTQLTDKFVNLHVVLVSFSGSAHSIWLRHSFPHALVPRRLWYKPFPHQKGSRRDNGGSMLCPDDVIFDYHEIDDYKAYAAFKMTIL